MCYLVGVLRNLLITDEETRARVQGDDDHFGSHKGKGKHKSAGEVVTERFLDCLLLIKSMLVCYSTYA